MTHREGRHGEVNEKGKEKEEEEGGQKKVQYGEG